MPRVLLIDDDIELAELATEFLTLEGFDVEVARRGDTGLDRAIAGGFDCIILDVMLPGLGGFEVLRRLRGQSGVPVLMLTARGDDADRILGLESGADDYLPKPFNPRELAARLRAVLRRFATTGSGGEHGGPPREKLEIGDLEMNFASRALRRGGEKIELTGLEFDLLGAFLKEAGRVVPRETLFRDVFGRKLLAGDRSIDTHVSNLRRKLGAHPDGTERFKNLRGVGYGYALPENFGDTQNSEKSEEETI
ncbi:MAG TPA: response regulator transcription factor [Abditibacterium sp.]|jgi:two-component system response regulator CpxR